MGSLQFPDGCGTNHPSGYPSRQRCLSRTLTLQQLGLDNTKIPDAGLEYLKGLSQLEGLAVDGTHVTPEGVKKLQQALPNCGIER